MSEHDDAAVVRWYERLIQVLSPTVNSVADLQRVSKDFEGGVNALRREDSAGPTEELDRQWAYLEDTLAYALGVVDGKLSSADWSDVNQHLQSAKSIAEARLSSIRRGPRTTAAEQE